MAALAGLAQRVGNLRPNDRYTAGMWEKSLLLDLAWVVWPPPKPGKPRLARYPSWSWASVDAQAMWPDRLERTSPIAKIRNIQYAPSENRAPIGEAGEAESECTITLEAPLTEVETLLTRRNWNGTSHNDNLLDDADFHAEKLRINDDKLDYCTYDGLNSCQTSPAATDYIVPLVFLGCEPDVEYTFPCERVGYVELKHPYPPPQDTGLWTTPSKEDALKMQMGMEGFLASTIVLV
ncbi:hypothetical protein OQA88_4290 [Cercophora sp. LCS_1]